MHGMYVQVDDAILHRQLMSGQLKPLMVVLDSPLDLFQLIPSEIELRHPHIVSSSIPMVSHGQ